MRVRFPLPAPPEQMTKELHTTGSAKPFELAATNVANMVIGLHEARTVQRLLLDPTEENLYLIYRYLFTSRLYGIDSDLLN